MNTQMGTVEPDVTLYLDFKASSTSPDHADIFMKNGGQINALSSDWETDFSATGSPRSTKAAFSRKDGMDVFDVRVELSPRIYKFVDDSTVELWNDARLNVASHTIGTAINGTLVTTLSSEGSDHLYCMLRGQDHHQIGLVYKTYLAYASTVAMSSVKLVAVAGDGKEVRCKPVFKRRPDEHLEKMKQAAQVVDAYARSAFELRQHVLYKPSPQLSKTVFSESVGVNGQGYTLLHDIVDRGTSLSYEALDSAFEAAIGIECDQKKKNIQIFLSHTSNPGVQAANEAHMIANAASLVTNFRMSYREDGRCVVSPGGNSFERVENWNRAVPRGCFEANDCDGLALEAIGMLRTAINAPADIQERFPYIRAIRNALFPYYQVGLVVLGASAPEASGNKNHKATSVAGHAIGMLVPTLSFLRARAKSASQRVADADAPLVPPDLQDAVINASFEALFPASVTETLPTNEANLLGDWDTAQHEFKHLKALAIEGTTPASSILYVPNPNKRDESERGGRMDARAFAKIGANVMRSRKNLHVGKNKFYQDFVEITFARDSPLWQDSKLREIGHAATQFVFTQEPRSDATSVAGCTPVELSEENYGVLPLMSASGLVAETLDYGSSFAEMDAIPPRAENPTVLSQFQKESLETSMRHVDAFKDHLKSLPVLKKSKEYHNVAYICAFNTLVFNPAAVQQFFESAKAVVIGGVVDKTVVKGLAVDESGAQCGHHIHIDVVIAV